MPLTSDPAPGSVTPYALISKIIVFTYTSLHIKKYLQLLKVLPIIVLSTFSVAPYCLLLKRAFAKSKENCYKQKYFSKKKKRRKSNQYFILHVFYNNKSYW
jgi:hypothetical protein